MNGFPFHNNPSLHHAVSRAVAPDGKLLYLSATPPRYLQKWIEADKKGDIEGKKAAEKEANDAREKGGRIGKDHDIDRVKELNEKIEKAKEKWKDADKIKDPVERQKAKDAAHDEANRYRSEGGTVG